MYFICPPVQSMQFRKAKFNVKEKEKILDLYKDFRSGYYTGTLVLSLSQRLWMKKNAGHDGSFTIYWNLFSCSRKAQDPGMEILFRIFVISEAAEKYVAYV